MQTPVFIYNRFPQTRDYEKTKRKVGAVDMHGTPAPDIAAGRLEINRM